MAYLMLQRESVVVLRRMIVDGIQDKFLADTVAAIINMVAFILKLVLLFAYITVFCETLQSLTTKSDLMTVNKVHRQERLMYSVLKFLTIEENKPD